MKFVETHTDVKPEVFMNLWMILGIPVFRLNTL